ncbi:MAG: TetR/AcrR family transcriptional regulator [Thiolinea sp.]
MAWANYTSGSVVSEMKPAVKSLSRREQNRQEKRRRALDAALSIFSKHGYAAASMDAIAGAAGMTKPTLYQYFASKDELFQAMMLAPRDQMMLAFDHAPDDCHVEQLLAFSWTYAKTVMHPEFLALARLIIGDAGRSPDIGRAYQASGPDRVLKGLAGFMQNQALLGRLEIDDAELAAEDFWGLILSAPRNRVLHIPDAYPDISELSRYIHNGIRVFLKAYSANPADDLLRLTKLISSSSEERFRTN